MAEYVDPLAKPKKNRNATACLVLGALSVAFAQMCHYPGVVSGLGCVGPILALAAAVTGIIGIRNARKIGGIGQRQAIGGMVTATISVGLFLLKFIPVMLTPGGALTQLAASPTLAATARPTLTPTPTPTPTETPLPTATPAPVEYEGVGFTITFTDEWETVDARSDSRVEYVVIQHVRGGVELHVYRLTLPEPPDLEAEVDSFVVNNFGTPNITAEGETEIAGRTGITKRFVFDASVSRRNHALLVAIADKNDVYYYMLFASSEEELSSYEGEALQIIASTKFGGAEPTATPPPSELETYVDEVYTLKYPGDWEPFDSGSEFCQQPGVACLYIRHPDKDGPVILVVCMTYAEPQDLAELDQSVWGEFSAGAELVSEEEIVVDDEPAIKRVFSVADSNSPSGRVYLMVVVLTHGNHTLQVLASTTSAEDMMRYQSTFGAIVASIEFTE
jgi:hypothetical protein